MSNSRKLKPPPTGYSFEKFRKLVEESDLPYAQKQELLIKASQADRRGIIRDNQAMRDVRQGEQAAEDVRHAEG